MKTEEDYQVEVLRLLDQTKKEIGYNPTITRRMVYEHGAVEATARIVRIKKFSSGFAKLYDQSRLDLSIEAYLLEHKEYHHLFESDPEVLPLCIKTLKEYGYKG